MVKTTGTVRKLELVEGEPLQLALAGSLKKRKPKIASISFSSAPFTHSPSARFFPASSSSNFRSWSHFFIAPPLPHSSHFSKYLFLDCTSSSSFHFHVLKLPLFIPFLDCANSSSSFHSGILKLHRE